MQPNPNVKDDFQFLERVLRRADRLHVPAIYVMWAALVLAGMALADFRPDWSPRYWLIVVPAGVLASAWLGYRWQRRAGQLSAALGMRHFWHWLTLGVALGLSGLLIATSAISPRGFGSLALLLVAFGYVLAGLHLQAGLVWVGGAIALAYVLTVVDVAYAWTLAGALVATALVAHAAAGGRSSGAAL
jgi:hypothetical protein